MKNKPLHIVFLTPGFAASETDSTNIPALQIYLLYLRKKLPSAKLTIITLQYPHTKKMYNWNGFKVIPLNGKSKRFKKYWVWQKAFKTLKKINSSEKIDALHTFWIGECSMIGQKFSAKYSIKHIATVMGQDAVKTKRYTQKLKSNITQFVTLSENHYKDFKISYDLNSKIIPWFIDTSQFDDLKTSKIDILGVGSLSSVKNYSEFIDIIFELVKTKRDLKAVIIGDGNLKQTLVEKIKEKRLENNIELKGNIDRTQVYKLMTESSILLHTSHYESFGLVFLEALFSGLKIVSYNVGCAKKSKKWMVCDSQKALTKSCHTFLSETNKEKEKTINTSKEETLNAYLNLYNA